MTGEEVVFWTKRSKIVRNGIAICFVPGGKTPRACLQQKGIELSEKQCQFRLDDVEFPNRYIVETTSAKNAKKYYAPDYDNMRQL